MNWRIFLIAIVIHNQVFAEDVKYLNQGETAPYNGFLFTVKRSEELRKMELDLDKYKYLNESLNKSLTYQNDIAAKKDEQIKLYEDRNDVLSKRLQEERSMTSLERFGWFALGVISVGLATYGINQATK